MAVDAFIKIGDIKGETKDAAKKDHIDVLSWSWGMSQHGSFHMGGGGGAGKADVQDLSFTKFVDKATPTLMKYCCKGEHIKEAVLTVRKAGGKKPLDYIILKLEKVIVSSVSTGGSGGEDLLTENITLNFAKFKYEYQPQKDDGAKEGGAIPFEFDIVKNQ